MAVGPEWTLSRVGKDVRPVIARLFEILEKELGREEWEIVWTVDGPQGRYRGVASVRIRSTRTLVRLYVQCPGFRDQGQRSGFWRCRQFSRPRELDDRFVDALRDDIKIVEERISRYITIKNPFAEGRRGQSAAAVQTVHRDEAKGIQINRAPVLTLWGTVVAERLGHEPDTALTLGKCLAGLNAQTKGRRLGICARPEDPEGKRPPKTGLGEEFWIELCGRALPAKNTKNGVRAVAGDKAIGPAAVQRYLADRFGDDLEAVHKAMTELAEALPETVLEDEADALYQQFRPAIPDGVAGWGASGELNLDLVCSLARTSHARFTQDPPEKPPRESRST